MLPSTIRGWTLLHHVRLMTKVYLTSPESHKKINSLPINWESTCLRMRTYLRKHQFPGFFFAFNFKFLLFHNYELILEQRQNAYRLAVQNPTHKEVQKIQTNGELQKLVDKN